MVNWLFIMFWNKTFCEKIVSTEYMLKYMGWYDRMTNVVQAMLTNSMLSPSIELVMNIVKFQS